MLYPVAPETAVQVRTRPSFAGAMVNRVGVAGVTADAKPVNVNVVAAVPVGAVMGEAPSLAPVPLYTPEELP
jgi:hypothetical protein